MSRRYVLTLLWVATLSILVVTRSVAENDTLKIGVVLPVSGPSYSLGEQIKVGVEIGIRRLESVGESDVYPIFMYADVSDRDSLRTAYSQLQSQGVDAVIGAATPLAAAHLRFIAEDGTISAVPTVLLSHAPSSYSPSQGSKHVLQMGLSPEEVYQQTLKYYIETNGVKKISIIYDPNYAAAAHYGSVFTNAALSSLQSPPVATQVFSQSAWATDYRREIKQVTRDRPDLTIVSAPTWDTSNLVAELSNTRSTTPIFIASPVRATNQMRDFAARSTVPIYYGAQFWPDLQDSNIEEFMNEAFAELGWSATASPSSIAIEAHDAVQVIASAWQIWQSGDSWGAPWDVVDHVLGLSGDLTLRDGYTMAGPLSLVVANPNPADSETAFKVEIIYDEQ